MAHASGTSNENKLNLVTWLLDVIPKHHFSPSRHNEGYSSVQVENGGSSLGFVLEVKQNPDKSWDVKSWYTYNA